MTAQRGAAAAPTTRGHQFTLAIVGAFEALAQALRHLFRHRGTRSLLITTFMSNQKQSFSCDRFSSHRRHIMSVSATAVSAEVQRHLPPPTARLPPQPRPPTWTISRALQWHYSDAPGGGAEMARGGAPPAPAVLLQIAAEAGYSGRGRRPAVATPSARLFSEHHLRTHAFFAKKIYSRCQRTRSFTTFIMTLSK